MRDIDDGAVAVSIDFYLRHAIGRQLRDKRRGDGNKDLAD